MGESKHCRRSSDLFGTHAAAMVDDQTHGHRSVFLLEETNILYLPVLKNAEVVDRQSGDEISVGINYAHGKRHQFCIRRNDGRVIRSLRERWFCYDLGVGGMANEKRHSSDSHRGKALRQQAKHMGSRRSQLSPCAAGLGRYVNPAAQRELSQL